MRSATSERIRLQVEPELRELVPGFLANRRKDLEAIGRALHSGNLEAIRVVGHNIRCFSRVYGFEELTALGEEIQQAAADASTLRIAHAQSQLASYLSRIDFPGTGELQGKARAPEGGGEKAQP